MAKKLKQGQKYPKGFTQTQILLKSCEKDRTPTSEILDFLKEQFYIREQKNIREHHLKILEKQKLIRRESAGRGHPDYWSVIPDFRVLKELVDRLKHYPDSQHKFMLSQYYRSMTHDLAHQFVDLIPNNDRYMVVPPSDDDELVVWIMNNALRENWLALKFVTRFISATDDERSRTLRQLSETACNPKISPTAAHRRGYKIGFCSGMDECIPWINEKVITKITIDEKGINKKVQLSYASARRQADMGIYEHQPATDKLYINWTELFAQLHHLNSNYTYLFD